MKKKILKKLLNNGFFLYFNVQKSEQNISREIFSNKLQTYLTSITGLTNIDIYFNCTTEILEPGQDRNIAALTFPFRVCIFLYINLCKKNTIQIYVRLLWRSYGNK